MNVVFGSTGVVGSLVLEALVQQGKRTRAVFHSRPPSRNATEQVRVDLSTGEGLDEALAGAQTVFLATGDMVDQVAAEVRVIEHATRAGVLKLVKLSILCAESEAFYLAQVHREIEREVERSGLPYTFLRPGGFMQNFVTYYGPTLRWEGVLRLPCGEAEENLVDARDVASVAVACLNSDAFTGQALDLCGPEAMTYERLVAVIGEATNRELRYESISEDAFREAMLPYAVTPRHVDGLIEMFQFHRDGKAPKESTAVLDVTGLPPRPFEDFARENAESWKE